MNQRVVKDYLFLFVVAGSLIALDQWTKWLVRQNIEFGAQWLPQGMEWLSPYARIVHWYNSGAAFGMFQNGNLVFTILAIIVICAIIYYYPQVEADRLDFENCHVLAACRRVWKFDRPPDAGQGDRFYFCGYFPCFQCCRRFDLNRRGCFAAWRLDEGSEVKRRRRRSCQLSVNNYQ